MSVRVVSPNEIRRMWLSRISYDVLSEVLKSGMAIAVKGSPQRVSKMRKRLSQLVGEEVVAFKGSFGDESAYLLMRKSDLMKVKRIEGAELEELVEVLEVSEGGGEASVK